jgi:hypothetical protein
MLVPQVDSPDTKPCEDLLECALKSCAEAGEATANAAIPTAAASNIFVMSLTPFVSPFWTRHKRAEWA